MKLFDGALNSDPGVEIASHKIPGPPGEPAVEVTIYRPRGRLDELPVLLDIHGGGYIAGSAAMTAVQDRALALELGCVVLAVDYRLAPETRHPGPVEDCYAALKWLCDNATELRIDRARIAVSGTSAGGGLAAGLVLLTRDRGEYRVAFQHLLRPMLDDRTAVQMNPHPYVGEFVWTPEYNRFGWMSLLGVSPGGPDVSQYASPARAEDLSELPPTFLAVGALDLFLEETIEYSRRLTRAGVPVELHVYPGAFHGFPAAAGARVAIAAERDSRAALHRALLG
jgi:acetyl esterase/lipase